jgi:hypothetical protein
MYDKPTHNEGALVGIKVFELGIMGAFERIGLGRIWVLDNH